MAYVMASPEIAAVQAVAVTSDGICSRIAGHGMHVPCSDPVPLVREQVQGQVLVCMQALRVAVSKFR